MSTETRAFSGSWASWNWRKCPEIVLKFSNKLVLKFHFLLPGALHSERPAMNNSSDVTVVNDYRGRVQTSIKIDLLLKCYRVGYVLTKATKTVVQSNLHFKLQTCEYIQQPEKSRKLFSTKRVNNRLDCSVATGCDTHVLRAFPNVWSSLFTVKIAAQGTFVSFSITTLQWQNSTQHRFCQGMFFVHHSLCFVIQPAPVVRHSAHL